MVYGRIGNFSGPVSLPNPQVGNSSNSRKENSANSPKENSANSLKENSASSAASVKSTDSQPPSPTYKVPKSQTENFLPPEITGTWKFCSFVIFLLCYTMCSVCGSDLRNLWGKNLKLKRRKQRNWGDELLWRSDEYIMQISGRRICMFFVAGIDRPAAALLPHNQGWEGNNSNYFPFNGTV